MKIVTLNALEGTVHKVDAPGGLGRCAAQSRRLALLRSWGLSAAGVIEQGALPDGRSWAVHELIPGPAMREALLAGLSIEQRQGLEELRRWMMMGRLYIGDLNPRNLIWRSGGGWIIIDCGSIRRHSARGIARRLRRKGWPAVCQYERRST